MTRPSCSLYSIPHRDGRRRLPEVIDRTCHHLSQESLIFFRADDIGIPSRQFQLLIECFIQHRMPLCLATVPSWVTANRFAALEQLTGTSSTQWCWHQHGHLHRNFEQDGKKQEFGPSRTKQEIKNSIRKGRQRLEDIVSDEFQPFFTPPWNRCGAETIDSLVELGFRAISRSRGAEPETVPELPDLQVGVDLHTRKEASPRLGFENLLTELQDHISSGQCGIMIHHQRMNSRAFELLDLLLATINRNRQLTPVLFSDLLKTSFRTKNRQQY